MVERDTPGLSIGKKERALRRLLSTQGLVVDHQAADPPQTQEAIGSDELKQLQHKGQAYDLGFYIGPM